jgi:hypothetical protein
MEILKRSFLALLLFGFLSVCMAVESGMYRLLSVSESENLILVSLIPGKEKFLLDAASVKITVDGKPAEFEELKSFSIIHVKWNPGKSTRNGIRLDGTAVEIEVTSQKKAQK